MRKAILLFALVFASYSLFAQESASTEKSVGNHQFEVMLGAAGGTDNSIWLTARAACSTYMSKRWRVGAGIEYLRIGMGTYDDITPGKTGKEKSYFASMANGVSFLLDFRLVCPLGKGASFIGVFDGGIYTAEKRYEKFGFQIGFQPGFRFRLNQQGGLALNIRPSYKYLWGAKSNVMGLMVGLSF